jgi:hypothetical protein
MRQIEVAKKAENLLRDTRGTSLNLFYYLWIFLFQTGLTLSIVVQLEALVETGPALDLTSILPHILTVILLPIDADSQKHEKDLKK